MENKDRKTSWKIYLRYAIALTPAIVILIFLEVIRRTQPTTLLENASFIIVAIAALFAGTSVTIAERSLRKTEEALELTRATTRPFLTVVLVLSKGLSLDRAILMPDIQNTGNLPADKVSVDCAWYIQENNGVKQCPLKMDKESPSIFFPGDKMGPTYLIVGREAVENITHRGSHVRVTIKYQNRLTLRQHNTRRTFRIAYTSALPSLDTAQAIPIPEEDYWD